MTALVFLLTVLALFILFIRLLIKCVRRKPVGMTIKLIAIIIIVYAGAWIFFYLTRNRIPASMGTEVCFDDWCATLMGVSSQPAADSNYIILQLGMSNHARGIAQSPSEPRVHILDASGRAWSYSVAGQRMYENRHAVQPGIAHRLELHESLQTALVFALPKNASVLQVLIEEGPLITSLLFPEDQTVFALQN